MPNLLTPRVFGLLGAAALLLAPALAQTTDIDAFKDAGDDAKVHSASGFVCPLFIGLFQRDAFGERDPSHGSDFCAYSARDGVYGTITLTPLKGAAYDAKTALAPEFAREEGTGGKLVGERMDTFGGGKTPAKVYTRTYETAVLETLHYRILYSGGTIGDWALEATVEFGTPRDDAQARGFMDKVYAEALAHVAKLPPPPPLPPVPISSPPVPVPAKPAPVQVH